MQKSALLLSLVQQYWKTPHRDCYPVLSLLYDKPQTVDLRENQIKDVFSALAETLAPQPVPGDSDVPHKVSLVSGIPEVDTAFGTVSGFLEIAGNAFNNALRICAKYAVSAEEMGLSTLVLSPSRGKLAVFSHMTESCGVSVQCATILSYRKLLQILISLRQGEIKADFVLIDGLSALILSGKDIPTDGKEDYLLAICSEIKALATEKTVLVNDRQVLVTLNAEGKTLGLSHWEDNGQRRLDLRSLGKGRYYMEEVTDQVTSAVFDMD